MKKSNKGFTLVELIVVLVILAILAAILVPALLGYIDKAREKQITTNAEAAYVAAQAIATEQYGKGASKPSVTVDMVKNLTDISEDFTITPTFGGKSGSTDASVSSKRSDFIIKQFEYKQTSTGKTATWYQEKTTVDGNEVPAGGWVVK
ncbi:MAG: type II secretion system protein [Eubacterium sp.]|nr:type II secretion system protein [Eubacterium sp.]